MRNIISSKGKTYSSGHEKSRAYTYFALMQHLNRNKDLALYDYSAFEEARVMFDKYVGCDLKQGRILDLGCGQRFPASLLFHTFGSDVTGIDTDILAPRMSFKHVMSIAKINGPERAVKTILRSILYDRGYYKKLAEKAKKSLTYKNLDLRQMDACRLEFPESHFDYIYSNRVFEHIADVEKAAEEVHRVLKPGATANIGIHLFPSLSGGHNLEWAFPDKEPSRRVPPWDHLREKLFPAHVYLNRWREEDYMRVIKKYFAVVDCFSQYEGEGLYTGEISAQISGYSKEDLLKRSIRLILKKK